MVVRKPAARRPVASAAKKPVPARKTAALEPKPAPAAKKATPARRTPTAAKTDRTELAARARSVKAVKESAAREAAEKVSGVHPVKKEEITAYDVLRAQHTYFTLYAEWLKQQGGEVSEVLDFVAPIMSVPVGIQKKSPAKRAKVDPEDRVNEEYYDRAVVEQYPIKELRELAADLAANGVINEKVKKSVILEEMEAAGLFREDGDSSAAEDGIEDDDVEEGDEEDGVEDADADESDDEDESDGDDDDDMGEENYTREDLEEMTLKELQELAEVNETDWKGLNKAKLIDELLADEEEESDEEDEDDEETIEIDPDELPNMDQAELLELCKQLDIRVPANKRKNKAAVVEMILESLDEDDDE